MMKWESANGTYFAEMGKMNNEVENSKYARAYTCFGTQNICQIPRPTT